MGYDIIAMIAEIDQVKAENKKLLISLEHSQEEVHELQQEVESVKKRLPLARGLR